MSKRLIFVTIALLMMMFTIRAALGQEETSSRDREMIREELRIQLREMINHTEARPIMTTIKGLENALLHVNNTNAIARITRNLERWQAKHLYNYTQINATETTDGKTLLKAQRREAFLFWKFNITDEYEIDEEGTITGEYRGFVSKYLFPPRKIQG